MRKLLRADISRLMKSKVLWLCAAATFLFSVFFIMNTGKDIAYEQTPDVVFFEVFPFFPVIYAVFVSMFLGTEYQEGTLRNKLIAGHKRRDIYFSSLAAAVFGCFIIMLSWALSSIVAVARFGKFVLPWDKQLLSGALVLLMTAAVAAILTLLCMLSANKAASAVLAVMLMLGLIMAASSLYNALSEPETITEVISVTQNGVEHGQPVPNPNYIDGFTRTVFRFAVDALPSGQAILIANAELTRPALSLCASVCITLITTVIGVIFFKRKNLK